MAKWIKCKKCGHVYMNSIRRCPQCYQPTPVNVAVIAVVLVMAVVAGVVWFALANNGEPAAVSSNSSSQISSVVTATSSEVSSDMGTTSVMQTSSEAPASSNVVIQYKTPTDSDGNIKVDPDGTVNITIPQWLLLLVDPDYDYTLTDIEKDEYRFLGVSRNSDGSATYRIGNNDYYRFRLLFSADVKGTVTDIRWLTTGRSAQLEENGGMRVIKVYTTHAEYDTLQNDAELISAILAAGVQVVVSQYFDMDQDVGTVFEIYSKNDTKIGTMTFPDVIRQ